MTLGRKENVLPLTTILSATAVMLLLFLATGLESVEFPHEDFLIFHLFLEIAIVSVSTSIFFLRWFPYRYTRDPQSLLIGIAFLAVAIFETEHAITYPGMMISLGTTSTTLSVYFWFFARFTMGFLLLVASFQSSESPVRITRRELYLAGGIAYVVVVSLSLIAMKGVLPSLIDPAEKTTDLVSMMYIALIAIFLLSIIRYWRISLKVKDLTYTYLVAALIMGVFEELAFMSDESVYDDFDLLAHLFGFIAFLFIFFALFRASIAKPYAELEKAREDLEDRVRERTAELSRSNKDLEQFAYVASHDIKAPLSAISGYLQILRDLSREKKDGESEKYIGKALASSDRMQEMIDDLLEYSRVGRDSRPFEAVDFERTLQNALSGLEVSIRESGAVITHEHLPVLIADGTLVTMLFQNLVGNAIKYRGTDPMRIEISARQGDDAWLFSVRDNGIGFDQKDSERIFKIFERLETNDKRPGTGIGLATCKRIVELLGGQIWAESEKGKGATFHFTVPIRKG